MDKKLTQAFVAAVKKQCGLYVRLKQAAVSEQKVLASKDGRGLDEIAKKQEDILKEIHGYEVEKKTLFEKMAADEGFKYTPELKLQDVLFKARDAEASEIEMETAKLIILMKENALLNANNGGLIKNFLNFREFTAGLRSRMENPVQQTYTPGGLVNNVREKQSKFDQKI